MYVQKQWNPHNLISLGKVFCFGKIALEKLNWSECNQELAKSWHTVYTNVNATVYGMSEFDIFAI